MDTKDENIISSTTLKRRVSDDKSNFKSIFKSKTFWVNVIALLGFIVQQRFGFIVDEAIQVQVLGLVNIGLRMLTKEPVNWNPILKKETENGTT